MQLQDVPRPLPSPCCQKDQGRASKIPTTTTTTLAPESEELLDYGEEEGSGEAETKVVKGAMPVADVPVVKATTSTAASTTARVLPARTIAPVKETKATAKPVQRKV